MDPIERHETGQGEIRVSRNPATGAVLYELADWGQSTADSDGISLADYIHALFGLLVQARARDTLIIGGAGGTLASLLAKKRQPASIVDIAPEAFDIARRHFALPGGIACHVADGAEFLGATAHRYDAMVLDAFIGQLIPAHLQTPDFFALAKSRMTDDGVFLANVHLKHDFDDYADRLAAAMATAWPSVRVLDNLGRCPRSAIVMAGCVGELKPPGMIVAPNINADALRGELARLEFRGWKGAAPRPARNFGR